MEARGEAPIGQVAVAQVVMNRVDSPAFPDTICAVVYQDGQFSWTDSPVSIDEPDQYVVALTVAATVMNNMAVATIGENSLYFVNNGYSGAWLRKLKLVGVLGNHTFYK